MRVEDFFEIMLSEVHNFFFGGGGGGREASPVFPPWNNPCMGKMQQVLLNTSSALAEKLEVYK
jgi:hypothetical protein